MKDVMIFENSYLYSVKNELKQLEELNNELYSLLADEGLDIDKLREASEGLLPNLSDAVNRLLLASKKQ